MARQKPVIGVTCGRASVPVTEGLLNSYYVGENYVQAVVRAGGSPLILPSVAGREGEAARAAIEICDGLILAGGNDVSPDMYGGADIKVDKVDPVRDVFEVALVRQARERNVPLLGICRGMEVINVAYGGTLRSGVRHEVGTEIDLPDLEGGRLHLLHLDRDGKIRAAIGVEKVEVLCFHHQAPDRIGEGLVTSAESDDGVIEALEDSQRWLLGVLWHPEQALDRTPGHERLYRALVDAARDPK
ncbi:MAG: gamma-glutamyl-gamma-aminobutyrate hydrolase family protein [Actinomycetota bacterium]